MTFLNWLFIRLLLFRWLLSLFLWVFLFELITCGCFRQSHGAHRCLPFLLRLFLMIIIIILLFTILLSLLLTFIIFRVLIVIIFFIFNIVPKLVFQFLELLLVADELLEFLPDAACMTGEQKHEQGSVQTA